MRDTRGVVPRSLMEPAMPSKARALEDKAYLVLLVAVSVAFAIIFWPFYPAVLWAVILAIVFTPLVRRILVRTGDKQTLAALVTLTVVVVMVILPAAVIGAMLFQEAFGVYARMQSGELNFARYAQQIMDGLPSWATGLLDRFGLASFRAVQEKFTAGLTEGFQFFFTQALNIGQNAFEFVVSLFVMLYLLFFLLRDGAEITERIRLVVPLESALQRNLATKFATVVRATVKGNVVVAVLQGTLGGLAFWALGIHGALLGGVVMALLSLLPAVGAGLVWLPVAIYLLVVGPVWQGVLLIAYGVLVIGLVDNVLRPILVGKETKLPDYVVLISTLGGLAVFGLNGFVLGPLIAAMFIAMWDVVATSRVEASSSSEETAVASLPASPDRLRRPERGQR
jgi:predicted PurR-regulated permease PerM